MVLVAVAVAASTRLGLVLTMLACLAVLWLGARHPAIFHQAGDNVALQALAWIVPNLTYFFCVDVLSRPYDTGIPLAFVGAVTLYCVLYVAGVLAVGMALFQRRQMAAESSGTSVPGGVNRLSGAGRIAALVAALQGVVLLLAAIGPTPAWITLGVLVAAGILAWAFWGLGRVGQAFLGLAGLAIVGAAVLAGTMGWFTPIGVLAGAGLAWQLWSLFGRGNKWVYWLVMVSVALNLVRAALLAAGLKEPWLPRAGQETQPVIVVQALAAAAVLLILLLPKTRRHFYSHPK